MGLDNVKIEHFESIEDHVKNASLSENTTSIFAPGNIWQRRNEAGCVATDRSVRITYRCCGERDRCFDLDEISKAIDWKDVRLVSMEIDMGILYSHKLTYQCTRPFVPIEWQHCVRGMQVPLSYLENADPLFAIPSTLDALCVLGGKNPDPFSVTRDLINNLLEKQWKTILFMDLTNVGVVPRYGFPGEGEEEEEKEESEESEEYKRCNRCDNHYFKQNQQQEEVATRGENAPPPLQQTGQDSISGNNSDSDESPPPPQPPPEQEMGGEDVAPVIKGGAAAHEDCEDRYDQATATAATDDDPEDFLSWWRSCQWKTIGNTLNVVSCIPKVLYSESYGICVMYDTG